MRSVLPLGNPPQLFDLETDPSEQSNLAGEARVSDIEKRLHAEVFEIWDPMALRQKVRESQRRRLWLTQVLGIGKRAAWDFQPNRAASRQYVRQVEDIQDSYSTEWTDQNR